MMAAALVAVALGFVAALLQPRPRRTPSTTRARRADLPADALRFLDTASRELRSGSSHGVAVEEALRVADNRELTLAVEAVRRSAQVGHHPSAVFDQAASSLRDRQAVAAERRAHTAQARLSARVLTVVPIGFAALTVWTSPSVREVVLSPAGATLVLAGLALNAIGWWWMRRIVGRASS